MLGEGFDPIAAFTRGDQTRAEFLRGNLEKIRDRTENSDVRRLVDEVLAGRRTVRELVREEAFVGELDKGMHAFASSWEQLTPEQRAALVRQGQAEESARRVAAGLPPLDDLDLPDDSPLLRD